MRKGKDPDPEADLEPDPDPYLRIQEAQKLADLADLDQALDPDPQHCLQEKFTKSAALSAECFSFILAVLSIPRAPASEGARGDRK
jgi:hypothetical protein